MSYDEKLKKLETLVAELEEDKVMSIDELRKKTAEAKKLFEECQKSLRQTEEEIQSLNN